MKKIQELVGAAILAAILVSASAFASEGSELLSTIDRMAASHAESTSDTEWNSVAERIDANRKEIAKELVAKLDDSRLTEQQITTYVWALGQAKESPSIDAIIKIYRQNSSDGIRRSSLNAIASIGGNDAGRFILSALENTVDKSTRFEILNLLGQLQYEPALSRMDEVLKTNAQEFWQAIFVFGKMGDRAVPFLLEKMDSQDSNTRRNAIDLLGHWLIPVEAAKSMEEHFWKESDEKLRVLLIASLETMITDHSQMKVFVERIISEEKSEQVLKFSRGTLKMLNQLKASPSNTGLPTKPAPEIFQSEYEQIFKSAGKKGNYKNLMSASTIHDEPKLKKLRERILQRNSDEAFYDYQKVNGIIISNRLRNAIGT